VIRNILDIVDYLKLTTSVTAGLCVKRGHCTSAAVLVQQSVFITASFAHACSLVTTLCQFQYGMVEVCILLSACLFSLS